MQRIKKRGQNKKDNFERLLKGFVRSVSRNGYNDTTIEKIVTLAGVSKRTFYEHFKTKEDCFLHCYLQVSQNVIAAIEATHDPSLPWRKQIKIMVKAYLEILQKNPILTQVFFLEIQSGGAALIKQRRKVHNQFAQSLIKVFSSFPSQNLGMTKISSELALAAVGGINELVLLAVEQGNTQKLSKLAATAVDFLTALVCYKK